MTEFVITGALGWIVIGSVVMFIASLLLIPVVVVCLPADYFLPRQKQTAPPQSLLRRSLRVCLLVLSNLLGAALIMIGFVMLFTPGQGVITMIVGLMLMSVPGKRALILRFVRRPKVIATINKIRARYGRPELLLPPV